jgi:hypothetical protein
MIMRVALGLYSDHLHLHKLPTQKTDKLEKPHDSDIGPSRKAREKALPPLPIHEDEEAGVDGDQV